MQPKAIQVKGKPLGGGRFPAICAPLVGRTSQALLAEVAVVAAKQPDLLEWRVDFFEGIGGTAAVVDVAARIKQPARRSSTSRKVAAGWWTWTSKHSSIE